MPLATFLAGCVVGAALATLLTHADDALQADLQSMSIPMSLSDAFSQIRSGWTRPTLMILGLAVHPLMMSLALGLLLFCRRLWHSFILRNIWIYYPSLIKELLETHAGLLGLLIVTSMLTVTASIVVGWSPFSTECTINGTFGAIISLWPKPVMVGLVVQSIMPFLIHPSLAPRLVAICTSGRLYPIGEASVHRLARSVLGTGPSVRKCFRFMYGILLLLSVLWIIPLNLDAGLRWWKEEVLGFLDGMGKQVASRSARRAPSRLWAGYSPVPEEGCQADLPLAAQAAATLHTLAYFGMLRRVSKSFDLQVTHYYKSRDEQQGGQTETSKSRRTYIKVGRGRSLLRDLGTPRWIKSYLRSWRWFAVTPPAYLFWYALSVEMARSCGWRRLLFPCLLLALNEFLQTLRLFILLIISEEKMHERYRRRSAHWLHLLELFAALHWITLAAAVLYEGRTTNSSPPHAGVLFGFPVACLVGVTYLEHLPGDLTDVGVLIRNAARVLQPGDLQHLISGNSWYRG